MSYMYDNGQAEYQINFGPFEYRLVQLDLLHTFPSSDESRQQCEPFYIFKPFVLRVVYKHTSNNYTVEQTEKNKILRRELDSQNQNSLQRNDCSFERDAIRFDANST